MPRYRFTVEYDGGPFAGWQRQLGSPTVQGALEAALLKMCGETVTVFGSGRTDSGVHATGQVAHVDLARSWAAERLRAGLNFHLKPDPISVLSAEEAAEDFHARFSARRRHYSYRIINRRSPLALDRGRAWLVARPLDEAAMRRAAQVLTGRHDFTTFRSVHCQSASPVKTLDVLDVERVGEEIRITATARSFLHNQVRSMVGSLKLVGEGAWQDGDMERALDARDRAACGAVAPPWGLALTAVEYD
ncbi:tRNA pseudouridine38-40 synthase [Rhodoligotrophos appendicifer]|uniref:tRNA pseudouridine(38-40) synthase TruA n=1 Tax=Rhodoligotrophos appendicifer TaxID=987056 RepID=UPI00117CFC7A|nr:tRNA pseudouridine(38-40) synthase TruA [Rhodoligotrophos appendicifer]